MTLDDFRGDILKDPELKRKHEQEEALRKATVIFLKFRKKHGLSQKELANILGTTQQAISRFETGKKNPSLEFMMSSLYKMGYVLTVKKRSSK